MLRRVPPLPMYASSCGLASYIRYCLCPLESEVILLKTTGFSIGFTSFWAWRISDTGPAGLECTLAHIDCGGTVLWCYCAPSCVLVSDATSITMLHHVYWSRTLLPVLPLYTDASSRSASAHVRFIVWSRKFHPVLPLPSGE